MSTAINPSGRLVEAFEVDEDDVVPLAGESPEVCVEAGPAEDGEAGGLGPHAAGDEQRPDPVEPFDVENHTGTGRRLGLAQHDDAGLPGLAAFAQGQADDVDLVLGPPGG